MSDDGSGELLKDVCDQVMADSDLAPEFDKTGRVSVTHCNAGALLVAQAMGCSEFDTEGDPLIADQMIALMEANASGKWQTVSGSAATIHALSGGLAFAAKTSVELGEAHGHIAAVYPMGMQRSNSWKRDVPVLANVGRENGAEKASQVFPVLKGEPTYFAWAKDA